MAVKSFRDRNPFVVGIASVLVIVLIVGGALAIGVKHLLEHGYSVEAIFVDSGGISTNDYVLLAGVRVGRVTKVEAVHQAGPCARKSPDPNFIGIQGAEAGCVRVSLNVHNGVHLGPSTQAHIVLETLLGARAVRLTGAATAPFLDQLAPSARVIPIDRTEIPFDIFSLFTKATTNIQATDTAKLNQLIKELAGVTQGKREQITTLLTSVTQISDTLNARDAQVRELLDRAATLSKQLNAKDQVLVSLIDQSQGILLNLQQRRNDIAVGLTAANGAVAQLDRLIATNKATLDAILTRLHPTLGSIAAHESDINKILAALGPGVNSMALATSHGPWQDVYIKTIGFDVLGCVAALKGTPDGSPLDALCTALIKALGALHLPLAVPAP
ncbi:MAG: phospholipid/cholesterol/gamma-HCH transport system substrate-binding protein [Acidimicrobiaceae bacterium]|nr:phospholipid/cholesterol/gamma-HCH transport system substrate-binding protein [Acidimicrobiaceae bacterium]